ncbi:PREDICTED: fasciclin-like arabinogalactan protein 2 [Ipomoea nil]|uniref:fasciclin-like arabinogalactan protein 2 n=1 Tax=Ipomoea nil TaxID=35883 RepID=UPI00090192FF|nr:PREDICTED: fasciclin-like arabinogalactan protein 2 [Ipomoea nil]
MKFSATAAVVLSLYVYVILLFSTAYGFNITQILAKHDDFSTFNRYLTLTHLAAEINRRQTITVLVLNNAAMNDILDKHYSLYTIKNILSYHVLADYFGTKKLHHLNKGTTLTATMFQATGDAPGTSGYVNMTALKGGKVGFAPEDNTGRFDSTFVKSVLEKPYKISVIQISHHLSSSYAEAPASGPTDVNITTLMAKQGCKAFADLLDSTGADATFALNVETGLTVFCPTDKVIQGFMPKYKNLSKDGKMSLLLYHGVPAYQNLGMFRSNGNGVLNTLATGGSNKYDFTVQNSGEDVTLETEVVTAKITGTMYDEEPLSVFKVDKVLLPRELFKAAGKSGSESSGGAPGPNSDDDGVPSDQAAGHRNGGVRRSGAWLVALILTLLCACI